MVAVLIPFFPRLLRLGLSSSVSRQPPPFTIELTSGGPSLTEASLPGKITVLTFWAHWCRPCRSTLPSINAVAQRYAGDNSVVVVAVSVDWSDGAQPIETFLRGANLTSVTVGKPADTPGQQDILEAFGGAGIPYLVVIDTNGIIRYEHRGFLAGEDLDDVLVEKIEELRSEDRNSPGSRS